MNLKDPKLYINRELSWLRFNTRVLEEAKNEKLPLLERLKFIAIYGTNLDEFYMIRVAGLNRLYKARITTSSGDDSLTPVQQLREIREYIMSEKSVVEESFKSIFNSLSKHGIHIKLFDQLPANLKKDVSQYFFSNLYPVIIPIAVDATHPFPHLNNLSFGVVVKLMDKEKSEELKYGLVRIPRVLPRFIEVESGLFVPIGSIVQEHIEILFPGYKLLSALPFRVTRNADMVIEEEEADDFLELLEEGLRLRKKGEIVRLEIGGVSPIEDDLLEFLNSHLKVAKEDIYKYDMPINLGSFWQIVGNKNFAHLLSAQNTPKTLAPLNQNENIMKIMEKQDIFLYHPYESFEPVVKFIQDASKDPDVLAIRMTLYRVGKDSPIVKALIHAALEGKQVTAMVELKARFDEENNLHWAKALEEVGAHVIYGIAGFKVHAKAALVVKKVGDRLKQYIHLSTGNYNPSTSRIYTDVSLFSCKDEYVNDGTRFFHFLTGFSKKGKLKNIYMAPAQIKSKILSLIHTETLAKNDGRIIAKMNALVDSDVIRALYKASQAGVKIDLIVRGVCCLKPKIAGVSDNIRVISIVGKYLEHARIIYAKNSNPSVFISSADWMPRNLERRVELLTPIFDKSIADKLIDLLILQINDSNLARELQENGEYIKVIAEKGVIDSQKQIEDYVNKLYSTTKASENKFDKLAFKLFKES